MSITTNTKNETAPNKTIDIRYYIHSFITLAIMIGFGYIPPAEPLTVMGMKIIGIFLGLLYGWSFVGLVWPSLAGLLALPLIGYMKPAQMISSSFGDSAVIMMLFIFVFSASIEECGLSKFISLWFITRKSVMGKPWLFTFTYLGSIYILGALTSASPSIIIGWSILYGVCGVLGYKKGDKYSMMMIFGTVFAGQLGMALMPFKQVPLVALGAYEKMSGVSIDYLKYMAMAALIGLSCLILYVLIGRFIIKPDIDALRNLNIEAFNLKNELVLNKHQKIVLFFLTLLIVFLMIPSILPKTMMITKFLSTIGGTGVVILLVGVMCFLKIDGQPLMNFRKMENKGVSWDIVLLLAAVMPISSALTSKESGFNAFLVSVLDPLFGGKSSVFFLIAICIVAIILTNLANNGAVAVALMPAAYAFSVQLGLNAAITAIIVTLSVHIALMTPAASTAAALMYGNDWIDKKSILKFGSYMLVVSFIMIIIVSVLAGSLMF